jgi:hypothetical protein
MVYDTVQNMWRLSNLQILKANLCCCEHYLISDEL